MKKQTEVVAALIWDGGRFMICQRPAHKARGLLWEFVGGKVEPGETKPAALARECREELGVEVEVGGEFMAVTHDYPDLLVRLSAPARRRSSSTTTSGGSRRTRSRSTISARRTWRSSAAFACSTAPRKNEYGPNRGARAHSPGVCHARGKIPPHGAF